MMRARISGNVSATLSGPLAARGAAVTTAAILGSTTLSRLASSTATPHCSRRSFLSRSTPTWSAAAPTTDTAGHCCGNHHPLEKVLAGTNLGKSAAVRAPVCDCCRKAICTKTISAANDLVKAQTQGQDQQEPLLYCCPKCDFDVCSACFHGGPKAGQTPSSSAAPDEPRCSKQHPLEVILTDSPSGQQALRRRPVCDTCRQDIKREGEGDGGILLHRCTECDYDMCATCFGHAKRAWEKAKAAAEVAAVEEAATPATTTATAPSATTTASPQSTSHNAETSESVATCLKKHDLVRCADAKSHTDRGAVCDRCRKGFDAEVSPVLYSCGSGCDYDLCESCYRAGGGTLADSEVELSTLEKLFQDLNECRRRAFNYDLDSQAQAQAIQLLTHRVLVAKKEAHESNSPHLPKPVATQAEELDRLMKDYLAEMKAIERKPSDAEALSSHAGATTVAIRLIPDSPEQEAALIQKTKLHLKMVSDLVTKLQRTSDSHIETIKKLNLQLDLIQAEPEKFGMADPATTTAATSAENKTSPTTASPEDATEPVEADEVVVEEIEVPETTTTGSATSSTTATSSSKNLRWYSWDPRARQYVDYSPAHTAELERAWLQKDTVVDAANSGNSSRSSLDEDTKSYISKVDLDIGGRSFTVDVWEMHQSNNRGHRRPVFRTEGLPVAATETSTAAVEEEVAPCSTPGAIDPILDAPTTTTTTTAAKVVAPTQPRSDLNPEAIKSILSGLQVTQEALQHKLDKLIALQEQMALQQQQEASPTPEPVCCDQGHTVEKIQLNQGQLARRPVCDSCRTSIGGDNSYYCSTCDYDLCCQCHDTKATSGMMKSHHAMEDPAVKKAIADIATIISAMDLQKKENAAIKATVKEILEAVRLDANQSVKGGADQQQQRQRQQSKPNFTDPNYQQDGPVEGEPRQCCTATWFLWKACQLLLLVLLLRFVFYAIGIEYMRMKALEGDMEDHRRARRLCRKLRREAEEEKRKQKQAADEQVEKEEKHGSVTQQSPPKDGDRKKEPTLKTEVISFDEYAAKHEQQQTGAPAPEHQTKDEAVEIPVKFDHTRPKKIDISMPTPRDVKTAQPQPVAPTSTPATVGAVGKKTVVPAASTQAAPSPSADDTYSSSSSTTAGHWVSWARVLGVVLLAAGAAELY